MTGFSDGESVSYVGIPQKDISIGDSGLLLTTAGRGAHVKWTSGLRQGTVTLEDLDDLVPINHRTATINPTSNDVLADSLEVGPPTQQLQLGHLCALRGPGAVLSVIASTHAHELAQVAQEARQFTEQRVAATAAIQNAAIHLDEEEVAALVRLTAVAVIRDTFGLADA